MSYIKTMDLKPTEVKALIHLGFILKLIEIGYKTDRYHVYVVGGK